jgi:hypothetical protein
MDLSTPLVDDREIEYLENLIEEEIPELNIEMFVQFYNSDQLGGMIRNLENWLKEIFLQFKGYKV